MEHLHQDLGEVPAGTVAVVSLSGTEANVLLLDDANYRRYKRGDRFSYFGGHTKRSPYSVTVPSSGHWHVAIDLGGYQGRLSASVEVLLPV